TVSAASVVRSSRPASIAATARVSIRDPGGGRIEPLALLVFLRDCHRQCLLGSLHRPRRIAHLLVEDQERVLISDLFGDQRGASSDQRNKGLQHACLQDEHRSAWISHNPERGSSRILNIVQTEKS